MESAISRYEDLRKYHESESRIAQSSGNDDDYQKAEIDRRAPAKGNN